MQDCLLALGHIVLTAYCPIGFFTCCQNYVLIKKSGFGIRYTFIKYQRSNMEGPNLRIGSNFQSCFSKISVML